jgi:dTDP-4-amino-4,6-dideoxygalactose transaminase
MTAVSTPTLAADSTPIALIPFNDLSHQGREIKTKLLPDIHRLFEASAFCLGPLVENFQRAVADHIGVKHAV